MFIPLNKHFLVEPVDLSPKKESLVAVPDDYKASTEGRYQTVKFLSMSDDCDTIFDILFDSVGDVILIVDKTTMEEVFIKDVKYTIVHQNGIVGVMENLNET
jgi:co-chaperonin GroES (HSP10)